MNCHQAMCDVGVDVFVAWWNALVLGTNDIPSFQYQCTLCICPDPRFATGRHLTDTTIPLPCLQFSLSAFFVEVYLCCRFVCFLFRLLCCSSSELVLPVVLSVVIV